jgi:hypothetical protein
VDGSKVEYAKRDLSAGIRPYDIDVTGSAAAIVGNVGASSGDNDSISLIDMTRNRSASSRQSPSGRRRKP